MTPKRSVLFLLGVTAFAGLSGLQCKNHYNAQACRIEDEVLLAKTKSAPLDTAVTSDGEGGGIIAWAEGGETYLVRLKKGEFRPDKPLRIEWRGGLDTADLEGNKTFRSALFRTPVQAEDLDLISLPNGKSLLVTLKTPEAGGIGGAFAALIANESLKIETVALGIVSPYAQKISALPVGDRILVVWDGGKESLKIQAALIRISPFAVEKTGELEASGEGPALAMSHRGPLIAWSEAKGIDDQSVFNVKIAPLTEKLQLGKSTIAASGRFIFASPELVDGSSGLGLVYRDKADKYDLAGLYFVPLSQEGTPVGDKQRISRADGKKGPTLKYFNGLFVSAAVRSDEKSLLIGINRFDAKAVRRGGEFQVYADITDYVCVDIAASDKSIITVFGEDLDEGGRVIVGRVFCAD